MRLKTEDILKPGAVLEVKKIDWDDPFVKKLWAEHEKEIRKMKRIVTWRLDEHGWRRVR